MLWAKVALALKGLMFSSSSTALKLTAIHPFTSREGLPSGVANSGIGPYCALMCKELENWFKFILSDGD